MDALFSKYDVLILPTVPFPAPKLPIIAEQEDEGEAYEGGRSKERRGRDPKWKHGHQRSGTGSITGGTGTPRDVIDNNEQIKEMEKQEKKDNEFLEDPVKMNVNCCLFNLSGHPAISVNCGFIELSGDEDQEKFEESRIKLSVGMQIVAGYMQESKLFRVARQVEILTEN